jgi:hypothetical protein
MLSPFLSRHYQMQTSGIPDMYTKKIRMPQLQKYEFQVNCIFPIHKEVNLRALV